MKKFKWPWPFKKKEVKHAPIDLSEFKEDLDPWLITYRALNRARKELEEHCTQAHNAFWKKINEIVGYELPGNWTFNVPEYTVTPKGDNESEPSEEVAATTPSEYEVFWQKLQATFYERP